MSALSLHLAAWWLSRVCPASEREFVVGDFFEELHADVIGSRKPLAAAIWAWRYVLRATIPFLRMRASRIPAGQLLAIELGAVGLGAGVLFAAESLRRFVFYLVPLRADGTVPTLGYLLGETLLVLAAATAGAIIGHQWYAHRRGKTP